MPFANYQVREMLANLKRICPGGNPNGIVSSSPGLRGTSYPGWGAPAFATPTGLRRVRSAKPQPRWGCRFCGRFPRVARSSQPWALSRNPFGIRSLNPRKALILAWHLAKRTPADCHSAIQPTASRHYRVVPPVGNRLDRRLAVGDTSSEWAPSDCQLAIRQTASLRHRSRLQI